MLTGTIRQSALAAAADRNLKMTPVATLVCIVIAFSILQQARPRLGSHPLVFLGHNLVFLALVMPVQALAWLAAFLGISYILAGLARRQAHHPAVFVLPAIIIFAVFKKYDILPLQPLYAHIPEILGLSYIIFRVLPIILEARDRRQLPDIVSYLNFCLSMFTFLSGPIQRYRAFSEDMERRKTFRLDEKEGLAALTRLMNGVIKITLIAPFIQDLQDYYSLAQQQQVIGFIIRGGMTVTLHGPFEGMGDMAPSFGFGLAALCYLVFLYFNFSGYTDMMIGLGRLLGFRLPENFDNPFAATSFLDFWKRWHISLSLWFRDYCFTPVLKRMVKSGIKDPALATLPAYFISFGLLGLWHGRTRPFILCGLMFAAGASANHFYRSSLNRRLDRETLGKLDGNGLYQALAASVTFFYISISITGLWLSSGEFDKLWHSFSVPQMTFSFGLIVACLTAALYLGRAVWRMELIHRMAVKPVRSFFMEETPFMIAAKLFLFAAWFFGFSTGLPDFVYQHF
jgi:D-alanyl-lipoteichoic acid acyltransferase DltB (MBOAT superfamily)